MTNHRSKKANREDWHPVDIVAALHKRGYTLRDIARAEGLNGSATLSRAMTQSYPASERRLAKYANVPVQVMFPTRYSPDGTKIRRESGAFVRERSSTGQVYPIRLSTQ